MLLPPRVEGEWGQVFPLHFVFHGKRMARRTLATGDKEEDMDDDTTPEARPPKGWERFPPGQLKQEIEDAWQTRTPGSDWYEVVLQIQGNNPISGYRVIVRP